MHGSRLEFESALNRLLFRRWLDAGLSRSGKSGLQRSLSYGRRGSRDRRAIDRSRSGWRGTRSRLRRNGDRLRGRAENRAGRRTMTYNHARGIGGAHRMTRRNEQRIRLGNAPQYLNRNRNKTVTHRVVLPIIPQRRIISYRSGADRARLPKYDSISPEAIARDRFECFRRRSGAQCAN